MELGSTLWILASYISILILSWLLAWALYYDLTRTYLPREIKQHGKLRCITFLMNILMVLGVGFEKLGICNRYKVWRFALNGIPPLMSSGLVIKDLLFDEVPVRVYWPQTKHAGNRRGIVYISGGVGLLGTISAYERVCRYIARKSKSVVVSVGYRLAPEHLYPVPVLDCCTATIHFLKNAMEYGVDPNCITIGGDSSGATFAAAVCQYLMTRNDLPRLQAQIFLYPFLQALDFNLPSYQQNHSVPPLFKKRAVKLGLTYLTGKNENIDGIMKNAHVPKDLWVKYRKWINADHIPEEFKVRGYVPFEPPPFCEDLHAVFKKGSDPMFSPLVAEDNIIRQLPKTFILTCEYDVVRDDGLLYKKRLEDNGVSVIWQHIKDGFHGMVFFIDYGPLEFESSRSCLNHLVHFLESL